ncbi:hypothetical protein [Catellatospora methionotrophica]|uniref:hypothetical protein n=1 Tax=Catellatospora methionotrophica TaxID=121620 RepID=UPI0033EDC494
MTRIISPADLRAQGASVVFPQSIDNQFMTADLFAKIRQRGLTLKGLLNNAISDHPDPISTQLFNESKTEYIRSLLYSRRIVVNRASFWNNPVLVSSLLSGTDDHDALVSLIAGKTIMPYLFNESDFSQRPAFHVLDAGEKAVLRLVGDASLTEVECVRLGGADGAENERENDRLAVRFRQQLQLPLEMGPQRLDLVVTALLGDRAASPRERAKLADELRGVAKWVRRTKPNRNELYRKYITRNDPVASRYHGDRFTFELKKWFDVVYNSNLPSLIEARTFTPNGMPTPLDAQLDWGRIAPRIEAAGADFTDASAEVLDRARNYAKLKAWDALERQLAVTLPAPEDLTHADVMVIRSWGTWEQMMEAMEDHIDQSLDLARMREFWRAYNEFLKELSLWWLARGRARREAYAAGVARIWRWGSWFMGLVNLGDEVFPVLPSMDEMPPLGDAEGMVEVAVETGMFLYQKAGVEWRRSQAMRGIEKVQKVSRAELVRMYESIRALHPSLESQPLPGGGADTATEETA